MNAATPPPGLLDQLKSFNLVFWIANSMEMLERLAYYGLRTVLPVYMVLSIAQGGPEFDHIQKGAIYALWALVQSGLPIFTGGYADRYGYKLTVGIAIAIKMVGYMVMAYALELAVVADTLPASLRPANWWGFDWVLGQSGEWGASYWVFLFGALSLAAGTAIFKPGLQGILGHQMNEENGSVGWSVFYQIVNVGGFLGPLLAGYMRLLDWKWVFISCAVIVALNYFLLLTFKDPEAAPGKETDADVSALRVFWDSAIGVCEPRLMAFLVVFSGFWAMFHQLFDLLPNYIDDWVDSREVVNVLVAPVFALVGGGIPDAWHGHLPQEYMININAGMIMTSAFLVGYLTGKVRSMTAMIAGILVSAIAIAGLGWTTNGWMILLAIAAFSIGEMMSSPTKMRYFSNIAPPGKKGLYLGYINATGGIGWYLGSLIAGELYERDGDKVVLARRYLQDQLQIPSEGLLKDQVIPRLADATGGTAESVRVLLLETYDPGAIWFTFATMGVISMLGLILFDLITRAKLQAEPIILTALTFVTAWATYSLATGIFFAVLMIVYMVLEQVAPESLPSGQANG